MIQLRKSNKRNTGTLYALRPIIRVAKASQAKFIVSKLITTKLNVDIESEALMFGFKDKKLHIFKEEKEPDNYHLGKGDTSTFRFRSVELYEILSDFFKVEKNKEFYLEMKEDFTFEKVIV